MAKNGRQSHGLEQFGPPRSTGAYKASFAAAMGTMLIGSLLALGCHPQETGNDPLSDTATSSDRSSDEKFPDQDSIDDTDTNTSEDTPSDAGAEFDADDFEDTATAIEDCPFECLSERQCDDADGRPENGMHCGNPGSVCCIIENRDDTSLTDSDSSWDMDSASSDSTPDTASDGTVPIVSDSEPEKPVDTGDTGGNVDGDSETAPPVSNLVSGLSIAKISFYQSVEIPLMEAGVSGEPTTAPVVAGKEGLMRVFVERDPQWRFRVVNAQLTLVSGDIPEETVFIDAKAINDDSVDNNLLTTFNFELPGQFVKTDLEFSVALFENGNVDVDAAVSSRAQWPQEGTAPVPVENNGGPLELLIVPVRYDADGSGRLPDTRDAAMEILRENLHAVYPIDRSDVTITVSEPMAWNRPVKSDGTGWQALLGALADYRADMAVRSGTYLYGIVEPTNDIQSYCVDGCQTGLAYVPAGPDDHDAKVAVGAGYDPQDAADTMLHELGHNHGLGHTPCGYPIPEDREPDYPYADGRIGSWGYTPIDNTLKDPATHFDIMGYCWPTWVSDVIYDRLLTWMQSVPILHPAPGVVSEWQTAIMTGNGEISVTGRLRLFRRPSGRALPITLFDASGTSFETTTGFLTPHSALGGGRLLFPLPTQRVDAIQINGGPIVYLPQ